MEIDVNHLYCNRVFYPFIPRNVFDALEAAFLNGQDKIVISASDYETIAAGAKAAGVCLV